MIEEIHEPIQVGVVFDRNQIRPVWFVWRGRRHDVQRVTYIWNDRQGAARLFRFAVTDGANVFELCFNAGAARWDLERVQLEG